MKALCWYGKKDVRVAEVSEPRILNPRDIIVKVNLTAIGASDLHLYNGPAPEIRRGAILGTRIYG